jgi:hypothetical protein
MKSLFSWLQKNQRSIPQVMSYRFLWVEFLVLLEQSSQQQLVAVISFFFSFDFEKEEEEEEEEESL